MQRSLSLLSVRRRDPPQNENSHHVFGHVTTLRAQGDVRDVAV